VATRCQPIAIRNVIAYLIGCLAVEATIGQTFDIGGPDVVPYRDLMQIMAEELHLRRRLIIPVPVLTPTFSSYWIQFVTPLSHDIAKPLAEGLKNPVVCRDDRIKALLPQELLSVRDSIALALSKLAANRVETSWSMAGPIPGDPDWAGGKVFRDERALTIEAPADAVFRSVCLIGGSNGWYGANALWTLRGWLDQLFGGPGLRRGRVNLDSLSYGEALDFWRVVGFRKNQRLTLRAEMKLPGEALLDFTVEPQGEQRCILHQKALFKPRGLWGLLYWYAVMPFHGIVFSGMLRGIQQKAATLAPQPAASRA
jgi:Protein of unknown function (DUF2867)